MESIKPLTQGKYLRRMPGTKIFRLGKKLKRRMASSQELLSSKRMAVCDGRDDLWTGALNRLRIRFTKKGKKNVERRPVSPIFTRSMMAPMIKKPLEAENPHFSLNK